MLDIHKQVPKTTFYKFIYLFISIFVLQSCGDKKPSKTDTIIKNASQMNAAVAVQMEEILNNLSDTSKKSALKLYNTLNVKQYYNPDFKPVFTSDMKFTNAGEKLIKFIEQDCRYFGLFPKAYHLGTVNNLYTKLSKDSIEKNNAIEWAKAELYLTDALFQISKHVKNGRLYTDTNYRYYDSSLQNKLFTPIANAFVKKPNSLDSLLSLQEPNLHDYDSLKIYLKSIVGKTNDKQMTTVIFPFTDSVKFVKSLVNRLKEEGLGAGMPEKIDSTNFSNLIKEYQTKYNQSITGKYSKEMIENMNTKSDTKFAKIALAMDKYKNFTIPNNGSYVIVNIPSYALRGYHANSVVVESKVAVGKLASKTPIMESEISDIIVMPQWFVPPSILKLPGYIDRHRNNPNYIVRGNRVIQKSGPGNALGEMKFNFKSGEAIYLHDTNEKWAFNSNYRAVSHGCVRVQQYKKLASFVSLVSTVSEKNYSKSVNKMKIDSITRDTSYTYKYIVKDSVQYNTDTIPGMVKRKVHRELVVDKKIPIYIKYFTCAIRNGLFVSYNDVYGYDKVLQEKYFSGYIN